MHNSLFLALDTSFEDGVVVIFDSLGDIKASTILCGKMSHGAQICDSIDSLLSSLGRPELSALMVGLGPGSFVGIRIALATALGYCLGQDLPLMGFCSHKALAYSHQQRDKKITLICKASGDLVYTSTYQEQNNTLIETTHCVVISKKEAFEQRDNNSLIISNFDDIKGPTPLGIVTTCLEKLTLDGIKDESDFIKPNYIKSPSVSTPKSSPVVGFLKT